VSRSLCFMMVPPFVSPCFEWDEWLAYVLRKLRTLLARVA